MPRVSVIIPCYNRGDYIAETVDSVFGQTLRDIELICVDDGSTDQTRAILEGYGDRLTLLEHPGRVNKGQSAAINLGLAHAEGEFIAVLDSDDLWLPEKLEEQVAYLDAHPETDIVYGNGEAIDGSGRHLYRIYETGHVERNDVADLLLDCYFLLPNNALVRSRLYDEAGGFDESLRAAQDHDMAIRLAERGNVAYLDRCWFRYRRHPDSISHRNADLRWRNGFRILDAAARRYPYPRSVLRRRRAVLHFRLAQCRVEQGRYLRAAAHALQAGVLDPARTLRVLMRRERVSSPH
ncbi:MAG: glycosyltransferase [Pseudomonadota bacterium]